MSRWLDIEVEERNADRQSDAFLIRILAEIWADPDFRRELGDERRTTARVLEEYGWRAYLDPARRQAVARMLFDGPRSLQRRCQEVRRRREESTAGLES